jgi:hypothetical protein
VYVEYRSQCYDFDGWYDYQHQGQYSLDSTTYASITTISIKRTDENGVDASAFVDGLSPGDVIVLSNSDNPCYADYGEYTINSINDTIPSVRILSVTVSQSQGSVDTSSNQKVSVNESRAWTILGKTEVYDGKELNDNGIVVDLVAEQFRIGAFGKDCEFTVSDWINNV